MNHPGFPSLALVVLLVLSPAPPLALAQPSMNILSIPSQRVLPGQRGIWFPVEITSPEPVQGFQLRALYDPSFLSLVGNSLVFTESQALEPEFLQVNDLQTSVEVGCIFDFFPPFFAKSLPPRADVRALHLLFDVAVDLRAGMQTEVAPENDRSSPIMNIFSIDGQSISPTLRSATVFVGEAEGAETLFTRGDADGNGALNLNDVLGTVNYVFRDGVPPRCLDAADFNDTGRINLLSILNLLNFLFRNGPPPAVPFPNEGLDPTADRLDCR